MEYDGRRPRIPKVLGERIDAARGGVPFDRWVRSALEQALDGSAVTRPVIPEEATRGVGPEKAPRSPVRVSAPARAPDSPGKVPEVPLPKIAPRRWAQ